MVTRRPGFTLIELLVVLSIVALLLTLALPRYFSSVDKSKEAVLKENLNQMRDAISRYYGDKGKYPESLDALVAERYLRKRSEERRVGKECGSGWGGDDAKEQTG